jgi:hypothetical protein
MCLVKVSSRQPRFQFRFQDFLKEERVESEAPQIYRGRRPKGYRREGLQPFRIDGGLHFVAVKSCCSCPRRHWNQILLDSGSRVNEKEQKKVRELALEEKYRVKYLQSRTRRKEDSSQDSIHTRKDESSS